MRVGLLHLLVVDVYPPFGGGEYPDYPRARGDPGAQAGIQPPEGAPALLLLAPDADPVCFLMIVLYVLVIIAWVAIVVSARLPEFIATYAQFALGWLFTFQALALMLTENY